MYETYLIDGGLDLESGRPTKRTKKLRERNARTLELIEKRVIDEIELAANLALESARTKMPRGESAAEGVYAQTERVFDNDAILSAV